MGIGFGGGGVWATAAVAQINRVTDRRTAPVRRINVAMPLLLLFNRLSGP
jgi:hypothetical protein